MNVPDLKQAESFFADTFGCLPVTHIGPFPLPAAMQADSVSLAMILCGTGANIELFAYKNPAGSKEMPKAVDVGDSHIAFYTDDVQAGVAQLKAKGITVVGAPKGKGYEKRTGRRLWNPKNPAQ